jgi:hypothetical protein
MTDVGARQALFALAVAVYLAGWAALACAATVLYVMCIPIAKLLVKAYYWLRGER